MRRGACEGRAGLETLGSKNAQVGLSGAPSANDKPKPGPKRPKGGALNTLERLDGRGLARKMSGLAIPNSLRLKRRRDYEIVVRFWFHGAICVWQKVRETPDT